MENDECVRMAGVTKKLDQSRQRWQQYYSWFPHKQNELYSEMDRIYKETRLKYGEEFFKSYAKERRLNRRIYKEDYSRTSSRIKAETLKDRMDNLDNAPFFYYYEYCGKHQTCTNN